MTIMTKPPHHHKQSAKLLFTKWCLLFLFCNLWQSTAYLPLVQGWQSTSSLLHHHPSEPFHIHHRSSTKTHNIPSSAIRLPVSSHPKNEKCAPSSCTTRSTFLAAKSNKQTEEDPTHDSDDGRKKRGVVRSLLRRFRGKGKDDDAEDESPPEPPIVKKRTPYKPRTPTSLQASPAARKKAALKAQAAAEALQQSIPETANRNDDSSSGASWTSRVTSLLPFTGDPKNASKTEDDLTSDDKKNKRSSFPSVVQKLVSRIGSTNEDEQWFTVFPKTRISPGEMIPVTVAGIDLLVIASNDGKKRLYCIQNACPHLGTPLELGQLVRLPREDQDLGIVADSAKDAESIAQQTSSSDAASSSSSSSPTPWTELQVSSLLQQDGCEDCVVCPLHKTAFALESGQPRGEWCPYPPVVGKVVGAIQPPRPAATFEVRVRGKDVQVRMNNPIPDEELEESTKNVNKAKQS